MNELVQTTRNKKAKKHTDSADQAESTADLMTLDGESADFSEAERSVSSTSERSISPEVKPLFTDWIHAQEEVDRQSAVIEAATVLLQRAEKELTRLRSNKTPDQLIREMSAELRKLRNDLDARSSGPVKRGRKPKSSGTSSAGTTSGGRPGKPRAWTNDDALAFVAAVKALEESQTEAGVGAIKALLSKQGEEIATNKAKFEPIRKHLIAHGTLKAFGVLRNTHYRVIGPYVAG